MLAGVAEPHHDYADPDPTFHFDAGRDPDPAQSDANLRLLTFNPLRLHFEPLQLLKLDCDSDLSLMQIQFRIRVFTRMRIRVRLPKMMRIRIRPLMLTITSSTRKDC
jgi:hypothetical protein